jgi:nucleoid-associated protein YgaU
LVVTESPARIFAGFCILAVLWIAVYWWWEPGGDARITFAEPDVAAPEGQAPVAVPTASPVVIPPSFVDYTIQDENETLPAISKRFFGTEEHADAIARANPIMDPQRLWVGRVIRVPVDPGNIQGKVVRPAPPTGPTTGPAAPVEYVILDGDTLSTISQQFYGTTTRAKLIFEHNRERLKLKSMDSIRAGQMLVIPPLPPEGG